MEIKLIEPPTTIKKVAAYIRVSTLKEEQIYSFENQKTYYETLIKTNKNWKLINIYADKGISGTTNNRPAFKKMIEDSINGDIDLILVKSISRFARNAKDSQNTILLLKTHNVEVFFEEQNLSSFNRSSEIIFNMMAMVAENEARSISQNTKWALDRLAQKGIRHLGNRVFGYDEINGVLTPNSNAKYVKLIFELYTNGKQIKDIVRILNSLNIKRFEYSTIKTILSNIIYTGDLLIQKSPPKDPITKTIDNTSSYNSYYVENHHSPIISMELYQKAQAKLNIKIQK